jgi:hypothetical protein
LFYDPIGGRLAGRAAVTIEVAVMTDEVMEPLARQADLGLE